MHPTLPLYLPKTKNQERIHPPSFPKSSSLNKTQNSFQIQSSAVKKTSKREKEPKKDPPRKKEKKRKRCAEKYRSKRGIHCRPIHNSPPFVGSGACYRPRLLARRREHFPRSVDMARRGCGKEEKKRGCRWEVPLPRATGGSCYEERRKRSTPF